MRGLVAFSLASLAAAAPKVSFETIHGDAAPILSSSNAEVVPNSYIIKFKKHVSDNSAEAHQTWIQEIHTFRESERADLKKRGQMPLVDDVFRGLKHTYKIGQDFLGYSGHFDEEVIEQVRRHPDVSWRLCAQIMSAQMLITPATGRVHRARQHRPHDACHRGQHVR
jgi:cerevisin